MDWRVSGVSIVFVLPEERQVIQYKMQVIYRTSECNIRGKVLYGTRMVLPKTRKQAQACIKRATPHAQSRMSERVAGPAVGREGPAFMSLGVRGCSGRPYGPSTPIGNEYTCESSRPCCPRRSGVAPVLGGVNKSIIRCECMLKLGVFCIALVIVMHKEA